MSTFFGISAIVETGQTLVPGADVLCKVTILKSANASPASLTITGSRLRNATTAVVGGVPAAAITIPTTGDVDGGVSFEIQCTTIALTGDNAAILVQYNI